MKGTDGFREILNHTFLRQKQRLPGGFSTGLPLTFAELAVRQQAKAHILCLNS